MNILITGCSSGFGYVGALYLARKGHKVYASMRNLKKNPFKGSKLHPNINILQLDVTNKKSIKNAISKIKKLDVLINNAGYVQAGLFEDLTEENMRKQMETNFFGVFNVTKACLPLLKKSKKAKIINMSSVSGKVSSPGLSAYSASKFAIEAISESMKFEFNNIDVHLIEPGPYNTHIFKENLEIAIPKNKRLYNKIMKYTTKSINNDVEAIPRLINKIINGKKGFRHLIGAGNYYYARKYLPFSWVEYGIKHLMKKVR